jgi:LysR family transcriptional regulator, nitrogen assimilation regulatory protein
MEFRHLRSFVRIATEGSFSRAASGLHIAQPALSQQIRQLEHELGVTLFIRHARGIRLSAAGEELLPEALKIIEQVASVQHRFLQKRPSERTEIRLGLPTSVVRVLGVIVANSVEQHLPHIKLQIVEGMTGYLFDWLSDDQLDVAILYDPLFYKDVSNKLVFKPLVQEEFFLITPVALFKDKAPLSLSDIEKVPLILPRKMHAIRALIDNFTQTNHKQLNVLSEVDSFPMLLERVRTGSCTLLPATAVAHELADGLVEARSIEPAPFRTLNVAYSKASHNQEMIDSLVEALFGVVSSLTSEGTWKATPCR